MKHEIFGMPNLRGHWISELLLNAVLGSGALRDLLPQELGSSLVTDLNRVCSLVARGVFRKDLPGNHSSPNRSVPFGPFLEWAIWARWSLRCPMPWVVPCKEILHR